MNDDSELIQRKAEDIPEWELEEMIRDLIHQGMRADLQSGPWRGWTGLAPCCLFCAKKCRVL
jgi:hypothetical protein